jgi:hypothetical protein
MPSKVWARVRGGERWLECERFAKVRDALVHGTDVPAVVEENIERAAKAY